MGETYKEPQLGEGNATKVSVSLPEGTVAAVRRHVGQRQFSRYVAEAVEREMRREVQAELVDEYEREHGPIPEEEKQRVRAVWQEAEERYRAWSVKQSA